jgi:hypothetical protein
MGLDTTCTATFKRQRSSGRALLETDHVLFRGDFRVKLPVSSITSIKASRGTLTLGTADGTLALELGPAAEKWAAKLSSPKSLVEKLGVKPGARVVTVGIAEDAFAADLRRVGAIVTTRPGAMPNDIIFFAVNTPKDLDRFVSLQRSLAPDGALWSVRPKGRAEISESIVMAAGRAAGLVDVKVARFSDSHTAEKFVRPMAEAPRRRKPRLHENRR